LRCSGRCLRGRDTCNVQCAACNVLSAMCRVLRATCSCDVLVQRASCNAGLTTVTPVSAARAAFRNFRRKSAWNVLCEASGMTARDASDLHCWRLADRLRSDVLGLCGREQISDDRKFCAGFCDAAGSVCRNLAEGFARYESGGIVQFFRYALASLAELKDYLKECEERGVIDSAELASLVDRCEHTEATATKFMKPHLAKMQRSKRPRPPN
jgi:four helix bundle protein